MGGISDQMLASGCVVLVESLHGETVKVLSGDDAGKSFPCVREIESDIVFEESLGPDPRGKRVLRFSPGNIPNLGSQDRLQTDDGKVWTAVRNSRSGYLTEDFELSEIAEGKDT